MLQQHADVVCTDTSATILKRRRFRYSKGGKQQKDAGKMGSA
jgi:hypothetical protein